MACGLDGHGHGVVMNEARARVGSSKDRRSLAGVHRLAGSQRRYSALPLSHLRTQSVRCTTYQKDAGQGKDRTRGTDEQQPQPRLHQFQHLLHRAAAYVHAASERFDRSGADSENASNRLCSGCPRRGGEIHGRREAQTRMEWSERKHRGGTAQARAKRICEAVLRRAQEVL